MKRLKKVIILFMVLISGNLLAQDLTKHEWKNRLVLILTTDVENDVYKEQIETFQNETEGFKERKLVVYHVAPGKFKTGISKQDWQKTATLFDAFKKTDSNFEILLLGFDGSVKLRQTQLLTVQKLYSKIDAMPMRQQEIRSQF